jgi:hypothetical protein
MAQVDLLYNVLSDGKPHRTDEILALVYGSEHLGIARIGARIADLKKKGHEIKGWKDQDKPTLYWYQMEVKQDYKDYESAAQSIKNSPKMFDPEYLRILRMIYEVEKKKLTQDGIDRRKKAIIYYANGRK